MNRNRTLTRREYNTLHAWLKYTIPAEVCENCGTREGRLERANVSGEYRRDVDDYVVLCVWCHRAIDGNGDMTIETADKKREEQPCKYGHTEGIYRYEAKTQRNNRAKVNRRCKTCQKIACKRYYARKHIDKQLT